MIQKWRRYTNRHADKHADKHALGIIVVAHKMVTIMWHMLHTKTPCQSRNQELYELKLNRMKKARQRKDNPPAARTGACPCVSYKFSAPVTGTELKCNCTRRPSID